MSQRVAPLKVEEGLLSQIGCTVFIVAGNVICGVFAFFLLLRAIGELLFVRREG